MQYNSLAINPQLCLKSDEELLKNVSEMSNYILERKFDGTRVLPHFDDNGIKLFTRNGKSELSNHYPEIRDSLDTLNLPSGTILDGELVFLNQETGEIEFQSALITTETMKERKLVPHIILFDVIQFGDTDLKKTPLLERKQRLNDIMEPDRYTYGYMSTSTVYDNPAEFYNLFVNEVENNREGVVIKQKDSLYAEGSRNKSWMKFKRHDTMDCVLMGITKGTGKYSDTFGALILGNVVNDKLRVCGYCSGMTDSERSEIFSKVMEYQPHNYNKKFSKDILKTIKPDICVEVEYMEQTEYGMLRHPRFIRFRDDKTITVNVDDETTSNPQTNLDAFLT